MRFSYSVFPIAFLQFEGIVILERSLLEKFSLMLTDRMFLTSQQGRSDKIAARHA